MSKKLELWGGSAIVIAAILAGAAPASAQTAESASDTAVTTQDSQPGTASAEPAATPAPEPEIVVTGFRASLQSALNAKRNETSAIDVIKAEDIADFPDANLAESLQRVPGVSINRVGGEGRAIGGRPPAPPENSPTMRPGAAKMSWPGSGNAA